MIYYYAAYQKSHLLSTAPVIELYVVLEHVIVFYIAMDKDRELSVLM